jgi:hypothetical protein
MQLQDGADQRGLAPGDGEYPNVREDREVLAVGEGEERGKPAAIHF